MPSNKKPPNTKKRRNNSVKGGYIFMEICVGKDYCIPPTFRREHQFMDYLLRTTD